MSSLNANDFLFTPRYHKIRHVVYWCCYLMLWAAYWSLVQGSYLQNVAKMIIWFPAFVLYSYPVAYFAVPRVLLKSKYLLFILLVIGWGITGWYFNTFYRAFVYIPLAGKIRIPHGTNAVDPTSFLCLTTTVGSMTVSSLTKRWINKQRELMQAEKEKVTAQLQLLKAQLHPHFLFNTLNNIYAFALENSPKTPQLILKLSSLLSYMLYECKSETVFLEKEVDIMKNYIDLEKERYGDNIDISLNIEGDVQDRFITPLLILPFLENAFKHGTSEQLDKPWMSIDIIVKDFTLKCKVVNSKNEIIPFHENGVGINNVIKRLELLYPNRHDLKLADEGHFFMVSLQLELTPEIFQNPASYKANDLKLTQYETTLSFNR